MSKIHLNHLLKSNIRLAFPFVMIVRFEFFFYCLDFENDVYHEEAIDTLTTTATPAAAYVRQLITPTNNNFSNSPIPSDGDENESTQGDNDIYCDANEDNYTATPILVRPVRSPPSMSISDEASFSNELLTSTPLSLTLHVPGPNLFYFDHIDIPESFYNMQQYVFNFVEVNNLSLESDVHLILLLSSIILLQNNNRLHKDIIPFFGDKIYQKVCESILDPLNMAYKFPGETLLGIIETAQSVYNKPIIESMQQLHYSALQISWIIL
ncbi:hypothetical protein EDC94DRAFT_436784 [Helicostylum pulchrum]|nr:hypothetical protein EDC94DRAFT_436784 [Helicostylum pulchrum]